MQNKIKFPLMAIIAIAGISTGAFAFDNNIETLEASKEVHISGSVPNYSLEDLSQGATYAISGKVTQIEPTIVTRDNGEFVFSDVTIKVKEDIFGNYGEEEITVRIQGGQVGDVKTVSEDDPSFKKGESVLVFVAGPEPDSIWGDNYYVAGMFTGKYSLDDNGNAQKQYDTKLTNEGDLKDKIKNYRADKIK